MEKKKPPCLQGCHLWLKSDKMIQESLKTTIREKALAENFTNQLRQNHFLLGRSLCLSSKLLKKKKIPLWQKWIISPCKTIEVKNDFGNLRLVKFSASAFSGSSF